MPGRAWHGDSEAGQTEPRASGWFARGVLNGPLGAPATRRASGGGGAVLS